MKTVVINDWNMADGTKLRHKEYGFDCVYTYDLCYKTWLLWLPWRGSYLDPDRYSPTDFDIVN